MNKFLLLGLLLLPGCETTHERLEREFQEMRNRYLRKVLNEEIEPNLTVDSSLLQPLPEKKIVTVPVVIHSRGGHRQK